MWEPSVPERSERRPAISPVALVLLILLMLGICGAFGLGYLYIKTAQEVHSLADSASRQAFNLVPLHQTVVVRPSKGAIVREIRSLDRLETSRYTIEKVLDAQRTRKYVPEFLVGEKLIFIAHGQVVAGIDLSRINSTNVQVSGSTVTIELPQSQILYSRIDNEQSHVYERDTGILSRPDPNLESEVRAEAEKQIREEALKQGILREAHDNAQKNLRAMLTAMGFTDIRFT